MFNTMLRKCSWVNTDAGLLVLRIGVGVIFIFAGWMKVSNLSSAVAEMNTINQFNQMGFGPFWAYLVSYVELIGGALVLLGLWTRLAALFLTITMAVAVYVTRTNPMMVMTPFSLLMSSLTLLLTGGGSYSTMKMFCGCGTCKACVDCDVVSK